MISASDIDPVPLMVNLGASFGELTTTKALASTSINVTLVDM